MSLNLDLPESSFKDKLPRNIGKQELLIGGGVVLALAIAGMTHWKWFSERGSEGRRRKSTVFSRYGSTLDDDNEVAFTAEEEDDEDDTDDADTVVDEAH